MLHKWDYDLVSLKQNWSKVCQLAPLPPTGSAHWSRQDSFFLQEVIANFPIEEDEREWKVTAANALTNHTEGEVMERMLWLEGHRRERPVLSYVPQPFKDPAEKPARVVVIRNRPFAPEDQRQNVDQTVRHESQPVQQQVIQQQQVVQQQVVQQQQIIQQQQQQQQAAPKALSPNDASGSASEPKKRKIHSDLRRIQEHNHSLSNSPVAVPQSPR